MQVILSKERGCRKVRDEEKKSDTYQQTDHSEQLWIKLGLLATTFLYRKPLLCSFIFLDFGQCRGVKLCRYHETSSVIFSCCSFRRDFTARLLVPPGHFVGIIFQDIVIELAEINEASINLSFPTISYIPPFWLHFAIKRSYANLWSEFVLNHSDKKSSSISSVDKNWSLDWLSRNIHCSW